MSRLTRWTVVIFAVASAQPALAQQPAQAPPVPAPKPAPSPPSGAPSPTPAPSPSTGAPSATPTGSSTPATNDESAEPEPEDTEIDSTEEIMEAMTAEPDPAVLVDRISELEARVKMAETSRKSKFPVKVTGYGDIGFFVTEGDGTGWRRDAGHVHFPDRGEFAWVFYGDLLATTVNTRGDVADLGDSPGVQRFDSIGSNGNPTFLANELNLTVNAGLGPTALFTSSVNFTPRTGRDFALGDSFDVDIVQLEWMPTDSGKHSIFVGKVDSVIGIEYKTRKPTARFGITPSLLARYTTGPAVGLKARSKLLDEKIVLAAAVTNSSFGTEQFHFFSEVDSNAFKTLSGRAALRLPFGSGGVLEIGGSGQYGVQDTAANGSGVLWMAGVDAEVEYGRLNMKAQWLKGKSPGEPVSMTYGLDLKNSGYVETNVLVTPIIGLLARAEFRDAEVNESMERLYITKNFRATGGLRLTLSPNAIVKAEYLHNRSYGGVPEFPDDVLTTSAVMAF